MVLPFFQEKHVGFPFYITGVLSSSLCTNSTLIYTAVNQEYFRWDQRSHFGFAPELTVDKNVI